MIGSSPRARGTHRLPERIERRRRFIPAGAGNAPIRPRASRRQRFIPAGAGNTADLLAARRPPAVHPRGRGERHRNRAFLDECDTGSSPRARGTRAARRPNPWHRSGSSPRARGTRYASGCINDAAPVHPRGRGERACRSTPRRLALRFIPAGAGNATARPSSLRFGSGSSPRARGTHHQGFSGQEMTRFIPAGAGNARRRRPNPWHQLVHPRGRGERATGHRARGSSPRARGTPLPRRASRGSSPRARGTRSCHPLSSPAEPPVHPRGRGERRVGEVHPWHRSGSSPRARGTRHRSGRINVRRRFIPAGAGNAVAHRSRHRSAVHPRGRGERNDRRRRCAARGSSPRARGTPAPGLSGQN